MKIHRMCLRNFLAFTGKPFEFCFLEDFNEGINVFVGENATGKTTLLKCIYVACEFSNQKTHPHKGKKIQDYFSASKRPIKDINQMQGEEDVGVIEIFSDNHEFHYRAWDGLYNFEDWSKLNIASVLIPAAEMLSHSKGLVPMSLKYGTPYDSTQIDVLVNAQLWETEEISERDRLILDKLGEAIDGEVIYEDDTFYVVKSNGLKVEYSMEAEGLKRLGLLWKLIRNGLLEPGSILLWDEPESSVHPGFMDLIAEVLHILAQDGVQIFVATHSYTFAKYVDLKKKNEGDVLFISLYKEDGQIKTTRATGYSALENNGIEESEEKLYDAVVKKALGES